ncbi:hypothetical protein [Trinickia sp. EG282A]
MNDSFDALQPAASRRTPHSVASCPTAGAAPRATIALAMRRR